MKRILSFVLLFCIALTFCACKENTNNINIEDFSKKHSVMYKESKYVDDSKVKSELVGQWGTTTKDGTKNSSIGYIFNEDGTASSVAFGPGSDGTYVIEEGKIILTCRVEHIFGFMTQSMHALTVRTVGIERAKFNIGLTNLIYNLCRYEFLHRSVSTAA